MTDQLKCPECASEAVVGHEMRGVYDGALYWGCLECSHLWHRWPEDSRLRPAAEAAMRGQWRQWR